MTRGKQRTSPKVIKKEGNGRNQQAATSGPATGKKRKKKKELNGNSMKGTVPSLSLQLDDQEPPRSVLTIPCPVVHPSLASSNRCSSGSSVENKPQRKLGRYECSSSDAMSTGHTSSSAVMDLGSSSNQTVHTTPQPSSLQHALTANDLRSPISSSPSTMSSLTYSVAGTISTSASTDTQFSTLYDTSSREASHETVLSMERSHERVERSHERMERSHETSHEAVCSAANRRPPDHLASGDTDRWAHACSDEEKERERIEVYKENRRRRYQNAIEEKRNELSITPRTAYYSTGTSTQ